MCTFFVLQLNTRLTQSHSKLLVDFEPQQLRFASSIRSHSITERAESDWTGLSLAEESFLSIILPEHERLKMAIRHSLASLFPSDTPEYLPSPPSLTPTPPAPPIRLPFETPPLRQRDAEALPMLQEPRQSLARASSPCLVSSLLQPSAHRDRVDLLLGQVISATKPFPTLLDQQRSELRSTVGSSRSPPPPPSPTASAARPPPPVLPLLRSIVRTPSDMSPSMNEKPHTPIPPGLPSIPPSYTTTPDALLHYRHALQLAEENTSVRRSSVHEESNVDKMARRPFPPSSYLFAAASVAASDIENQSPPPPRSSPAAAAPDVHSSFHEFVTMGTPLQQPRTSSFY